MEFKSHQGDIGMGQHIMLNTLASHPDTWVVVVRYKRNPNDPSDLTNISEAQLLGHPPVRADLTDVQAVLRLFHDWAIQRPWQNKPAPNPAPWIAWPQTA